MPSTCLTGPFAAAGAGADLPRDLGVPPAGTFAAVHAVVPAVHAVAAAALAFAAWQLLWCASGCHIPQKAPAFSPSRFTPAHLTQLSRLPCIRRCWPTTLQAATGSPTLCTPQRVGAVGGQAIHLLPLAVAAGTASEHNALRCMARAVGHAAVSKHSFFLPALFPQSTTSSASSRTWRRAGGGRPTPTWARCAAAGA